MSALNPLSHDNLFANVPQIHFEPLPHYTEVNLWIPIEEGKFLNRLTPFCERAEHLNIVRRGHLNQGNTALHMAIEKGNRQAVRILLSYGEKINFSRRNLRGQTPWQLAKSKGMQDSFYEMRMHLQAGDDDLIDYLAYRDEIEALLKENHRSDEQVKAFQEKALRCRDWERLSALIEGTSSLDINLQDPDTGETALHLACLYGSIEEIEMLLKYSGSDPLIKNRKGETALFNALARKDPVYARALLTRVRTFDINEGNAGGETPLHLACEKGDWSLIYGILTYPKIDPNICDGEGVPPIFSLIKAKRGKHFLPFLQNAPRLDLNLRDSKGNAVLHHACRLGAIDWVEAILLRAEVAVDALNKDGDTPFLLACQLSHNNLICRLFSHEGINVEYVNPKTRESGLTIAYEKENLVLQKLYAQIEARLLAEHHDSLRSSEELTASLSDVSDESSDEDMEEVEKTIIVKRMPSWPSQSSSSFVLYYSASELDEVDLE